MNYKELALKYSSKYTLLFALTDKKMILKMACHSDLEMCWYKYIVAFLSFSSIIDWNMLLVYEFNPKLKDSFLKYLYALQTYSL